jgi:hypothetical protein
MITGQMTLAAQIGIIRREYDVMKLSPTIPGTYNPKVANVWRSVPFL